jgi:xanthine dehydrogenase/oxidase
MNEPMQLFADDVQARRMLYATMVLATKAHARVVSIDASPALALPGVRAFYSAKNVPVNVGELFKVRPPPLPRM